MSLNETIQRMNNLEKKQIANGTRVVLRSADKKTIITMNKKKYLENKKNIDEHLSNPNNDWEWMTKTMG